MQKKIASFISVVLLPFLLSACVPTAFVAGAAAGGAVLYDQRNMQTMVKDRDITFRLQNKIDEAMLNYGKGKTHVSVATFNRNVLLVGQVTDNAMHDEALKLAKREQDVKNIYDEIKIGTPISNEDIRHDVWLTSQVIGALLGAKGLHTSQIKVVTEDNVVYLMGIISREKGQLAAETAQKVDGVKKIVKVFEYL